MFTRRQFLKKGLIFVPATGLVRRALGFQGMTINDGPFMFGGSGCSAAANAATAAWSALVVSNGGAAPSAATQAAMCAFYDATVSIQSKIKGLLMIVPDNITAALTPFFQGGSNALWGSVGASWELTVNGLRATAANTMLRSGLIPSSIFANDTTSGIGCYIHTTHAADGGADTDMGCQNGSTQSCVLYTNFNSSFSAGQIYSNTGGGITSLTIGTGFWSVNITNSTTGVMYFANSGTAFADIGHIGGPGEPGTVTGTRPTVDIACMGQNNGGVTVGAGTVRRYSCFFVNNPFTSSEAQILYNAIQACRTSLGGGFV